MYTISRIAREREMSMEQRSQEWLEFRANKVTASKAAAALGLCPYKSTRKLWKIMTGRQKEEFSPFALRIMKQGQDDEPIIAGVFSYVTGMVVQPCNIFVHPNNTRIAASPDGFVFDGVNIRHACVEFKRPAKALYDEVRLYHWVQIQLQMQCTGLDLCYFCAWTPEQSYRIWTIEYSPDFAKWSFERLNLFLSWVDNDTIPPIMRDKVDNVFRWEKERDRTTSPYDARDRVLRRTGCLFDETLGSSGSSAE